MLVGVLLGLGGLAAWGQQTNGSGLGDVCVEPVGGWDHAALDRCVELRVDEYWEAADAYWSSGGGGVGLGLVDKLAAGRRLVDAVRGLASVLREQARQELLGLVAEREGGGGGVGVGPLGLDSQVGRLLGVLQGVYVRVEAVGVLLGLPG